MAGLSGECSPANCIDAPGEPASGNNLRPAYNVDGGSFRSRHQPTPITLIGSFPIHRLDGVEEAVNEPFDITRLPFGDDQGHHAVTRGSRGHSTPDRG